MALQAVLVLGGEKHNKSSELHEQSHRLSSFSVK